MVVPILVDLMTIIILMSQRRLSVVGIESCVLLREVTSFLCFLQICRERLRPFFFLSADLNREITSCLCFLQISREK